MFCDSGLRKVLDNLLEVIMQFQHFSLTYWLVSMGYNWILQMQENFQKHALGILLFGNETVSSGALKKLTKNFEVVLIPQHCFV